MRPALSIIVLLTTIVQLSTTLFIHPVWSFVRINTARLPRFASESQHPWYKENGRRLRSFPNAREELCSLNSTLRPGIGRNMTYQYPPDLFHDLKIHCHPSQTGSWHEMLNNVDDLLACPAALNDVRSLSVQIRDDAYHWDHGAYPALPERLPQALVQVFNNTRNLVTLKWNTNLRDFVEIRQSLTSANVSLPSVTTFETSPFSEWWITMLPNLEIVRCDMGYWQPDPRPEGDARDLLIEATAAATNLSTFGMSGSWRIEHLQALLQSNPDLRAVDITGRLAGADRYGMHDMFDDYDYDYDYMALSEFNSTVGPLLPDFVSTLQQFGNLTNLTLPHVLSLKLGVRPGPGCGNAYFGPGGRAYGRSLTQEWLEAEDKVARYVLEQLPGLAHVSIGGSVPKLIRSENGTLQDIQWCWTGRLQEYIYEEWPEPKVGSPDYDF